MTILRGGISGCGKRGRVAVESVRRHGHCDVVALFDPDEAALQTLGSLTGIDTRCASFDALLHTGIDFVILTGPAGGHRQQVEAAAAQGVHCLVHAPFALDAGDADAMVAASERAGIKLGVLIPEQADPLLEQVRQFLNHDCFGGIVLVQSLIGDDDVLRHPPAAGDWRRDPEQAGAGAFLRLSSGQLSTCTWLVGRPVVEVAALGSHGFTSLDEDATAVTARLRGGALCTFAASHLTRGQHCAFYGNDGYAVLAPDRLRLCARIARHDVLDYPEPRKERSYLRSEVKSLLAASELQLELHGRFARWIDDRDDFPCTGEQAAIDQRALDAVRRSVLEGKAMTV